MPVVDASVMVAAVRPAEVHHAAARTWLASALRADDRLLAPSILLSEVGGAIGRATRQPALAHRIVQAIQARSTIDLVPVSVPLAHAAARIAADLALRGADALYVALAMETGEALITLDQEVIHHARSVAVVESPEGRADTP